MNPLSNLPSYIRQSTLKREIMDEETARLVVLYVHRFFADVQAELNNSVVLRNQIRDWLVGLVHHRTGEALAVSTKKGIAGIVGRYCKDGGWLTEADHTKLGKSFQPHYSAWSTKALSDDNTARLIRHLQHKAKWSFTKSRNLLVTMTMLAAGLRIGQIVKLSQNDVFQSDDTYTVLPTLQKSFRQGKSRKNIPLSVVIGGMSVGEALQWYNDKRDTRAAMFFHNQDGGEISAAYYRQIFGQIEDRLGFPFSAHSCRHTAGTRIATKVSVLAAANILDHSNIRMTQRYISLESEMSDKIIADSFA